jgi:glutamate-ammonia-ligase adenylyltransferase
VLQLRHGIGLDPRLRQAAAVLAQAELVPPASGPAHALMTRLLVTLRLMSPASLVPPPAARTLVARACRQHDWDQLDAAYRDARALIAAEWARVAGGLPYCAPGGQSGGNAGGPS